MSVAKQQNYYRTFLHTQEGKEVLLDIIQQVELFEKGSAEEFQVATTMLKMILTNCGITANMALMDALAQLAQKYREPRPPMPRKPLETSKDLLT